MKLIGDLVMIIGWLIIFPVIIALSITDCTTMKVIQHVNTRKNDNFYVETRIQTFPIDRKIWIDLIKDENDTIIQYRKKQAEIYMYKLQKIEKKLNK